MVSAGIRRANPVSGRMLYGARRFGLQTYPTGCTAQLSRVYVCVWWGWLWRETPNG